MNTSEPRRTAALGPDPTEEQLRAEPVLGSVDDLLIEDLTDEEDDAFAAALQREPAMPRTAERPARRHVVLAGIGESETGLSDRIDEFLADGFGES